MYKEKETELTIPKLLQVEDHFNFENGKGYFFSNDNYYVTVLEQLSELNKKPSLPTASAALIVGNGFGLSTLPEIQASTILFCDIEPRVLQWTRHCLTTFAKLTPQDNLAELEEKYKQQLFGLDQPTEQQVMTRNALKLGYEDEKTFLEEFHCFASQARFAQCQKAIAEKTILFLKIDLFNADQATLLAQLLQTRKLKLSFLNATNLMSWDPTAFKNTLSILPCEAKMTIVYSKPRTVNIPTLDCQNLCFSMTDFFKKLDGPARAIAPMSTPSSIFHSSTNQPRGYHIHHWGQMDAVLSETKGCCNIL